MRKGSLPDPRGQADCGAVYLIKRACGVLAGISSHVLEQMSIGSAAAQEFGPLTQSQRITPADVSFRHGDLINANNQTAMNSPKNTRIQTRLQVF